MAEAAREAWLRYRGALGEALESPSLLGPRGGLEGVLDDPPSVEQALAESDDLDQQCRDERTSGVEDEDQSIAQLLAGAMIDFLFATELAISAANDEGVAIGTDQVARFNRWELWREAISLADSTFGIGEGTGGTPAPVLPYSPLGPLTPPQSPSWEPETEPPLRPGSLRPMAGAAPDANAAEIRSCCLQVADEMIEDAATPTTRVLAATLGPATAVAGPLTMQIVGHFGGTGVPAAFPDYLRDLAGQAKRRTGWALTAVERFARKVLALLPDNIGGAVGSEFPALVNELVQEFTSALTERGLRRVAAHDHFKRALTDCLNGTDPSDAGRIQASVETNAARKAYEKQMKHLQKAMLGASVFAAVLSAITTPIVPLGALLLVLLYIVYSLRSRFETLPLIKSDGIPSIASRCAQM